MLSLLLLLLLASLLLFSPLTFAAPTNVTVDDQDVSRIDYQPLSEWDHRPLTGWESHFYNGSRTFTWTPNATATFTFTGAGIYLQGPFAPDQALRRITLDGEDQGVYGAYADERTPSHPFWSRTDLVYTTHTVLVEHVDTRDKIFAMDAWIVEFDPVQTPLPYSTTTTTITATSSTTDSNGNVIPVGVVTSTSMSSGGGGGGGGDENDPSRQKKVNLAIILGVVIPINIFLFLCILGVCIYRRRRTQSRQRRQETFREKLFRSGKRGTKGATGAGLYNMNNDNFSGIAMREQKSTGLASSRSPKNRPMSAGTYASTHYSTAPENEIQAYGSVSNSLTPSPTSPRFNFTAGTSSIINKGPLLLSPTSPITATGASAGVASSAGVVAGGGAIAASSSSSSALSHTDGSSSNHADRSETGTSQERPNKIRKNNNGGVTYPSSNKAATTSAFNGGGNGNGNINTIYQGSNTSPSTHSTSSLNHGVLARDTNGFIPARPSPATELAAALGIGGVSVTLNGGIGGIGDSNGRGIGAGFGTIGASSVPFHSPSTFNNLASTAPAPSPTPAMTSANANTPMGTFGVAGTGALAAGAATGASSSSASLQKNKSSTQDSTHSGSNAVERAPIPIAAPIAPTAALAAAAAAGAGGNAGTPPSAWLTSFDNYNAQNASHTPSTLFSEPDSAFSTRRLQQPPLSPPPPPGNGRQNSRYSQVSQQPRVDNYAVSPFADAFNNTDAGPSSSANANPRHSGPTRSNSLLKRFSAAIVSPFTRSPNNRNSTGASGYHYRRNSLLLQQQNNPSSPTADGAGDANGNGANGYYRGMSHFNLGIPLNYRPVATAASPTSTDPAFGFARQQQQTLKTEYNGEVVSPTTTAANRRGSRAGIDDLAFSSYTQETRDRIMGSRASPLSHPPAPGTNRGSGDDRIAEEGSTDVRSDADDEKDEKIVEYDGSTMYGSINDREVGYTGGKRWSVDQGTENGTVVSRSGSQRAPSEGTHPPESSQLSRRQSTRSGRSDGNARQPHPPPSYTPLNPSDNKPSPPPS